MVTTKDINLKNLLRNSNERQRSHLWRSNCRRLHGKTLLPTTRYSSNRKRLTVKDIIRIGAKKFILSTEKEETVRVRLLPNRMTTVKLNSEEILESRIKTNLACPVRMVEQNLSLPKTLLIA